jgi:SAM-dependent methyltransferase
MSEERPPTSVARFGEVDDAVDPGAFLAHLDRVRAQPQVQEGKRRRLARLGLGPGERVLEVGCGTGEETQAMALLVGSAGRAVGVDRSEMLLGEGVRRAREAGSSAQFLVGDAVALPLGDGSVDAYYAERVFQHLPDPLAALREARRVLVPNGRILVADQDWDSLVISSSARPVTRRVVEAMASAAVNGSIGTDLAYVLREAGFVDVNVEVAPVLIDRLELLLPLVQTGLDAALAARGLDAGEAEAWVEDLRQRDAAGGLVAAFTMFEVAATRDEG